MLFQKLLNSVISPIEMTLEVPPKSKVKKERKSTKKKVKLQLDGEIWKDVCGLEEKYQVSSLGRVRRKPRQILRSNGRIQHLNWKILKPEWKPGGVNPRYSLIDANGVQIKPYVQMLMSEAFGFIVDPTKVFQRLEPFVLPTLKDLTQVTRSEILTGTTKRRRESLTIEDKKMIVMLRRRGLSRDKVSKIMNLTPEHVSHITGNVSAQITNN